MGTTKEDRIGLVSAVYTEEGRTKGTAVKPGVPRVLYGSGEAPGSLFKLKALLSLGVLKVSKGFSEV